MIKSDFSQARVYTDLQGMEKLRQEGRKNNPEALREVARQFESLMMQQIMRSARATNEMLTEGTFLDSQALRFHQQMLDDQLSLEMTRQGQGFGLAEVLVRQLSKDYGIETEQEQATPQPKSIQEMLERGSRVPARHYDFTSQTDTASPAQEASKATLPANEVEADKSAVPAQSVEQQGIEKRTRFNSPADFVSTLYPDAVEAAQGLGVAPRVMLAQAALETGWGRFMITHEDGSNSHNLFGIKADQRWSGERAVVSTLEYRDGVPRREKAAFRAYGSYADSFKDYADFLRSNPRYTEALKHADDPAAFTQGLQQAGYATDPAYARKIMRILNSTNMVAAVDGLKKSSG